MKLFVLFLLSLFSFVFSLPLVVRDVYDPQVLYPNNTTVWAVGEKHHVVWYDLVLGYVFIVSYLTLVAGTHPILQTKSQIPLGKFT